MSCSRRLLISAIPATLAGCGFSPLYADGSIARDLNGTIAIAPMEGSFGFIMRERLETRLGPVGAERFRLDVTTRIDEDERAIRAEGDITRFTLDATANFTVTPVNGERPVFADSARAFTAYSAIASPFATRVAEEDAFRRLAEALADQIALKIAATAQDWAA